MHFYFGASCLTFNSIGIRFLEVEAPRKSDVSDQNGGGGGGGGGGGVTFKVRYSVFVCILLCIVHVGI